MSRDVEIWVKAAELRDEVASLQARLSEAREALCEIAFAGEGKDVRGMAQASLQVLARRALSGAMDAVFDSLAGIAEVADAEVPAEIRCHPRKKLLGASDGGNEDA